MKIDLGYPINKHHETMEYEKYALILKHYMTESSGNNVMVDEPLVVTFVTPIGQASFHMVNAIFESLWQGMKTLILAQYYKEDDYED